MKAQIIPIGNSKGVRIPRALLELCHMTNAVDLNVKGRTIVIQPIKRRPRDGWEEAFRAMHDKGEDRLLIDEPIDLDLGPWEW